MPTGIGLLLPFKRNGKGDFATGSGDELIRSQIRLVLGCRGDSQVTVGELPWRTSFGSELDSLRHLPLDSTTIGIADSKVRDAFKRWLGHLLYVNVSARRDGERLLLFVSYRKRNSPETFTERITI